LSAACHSGAPTPNVSLTRRALASNRAADGHSVSKIDVLAGDRDDGPERRQRALQLPARLAAPPEQQDATTINFGERFGAAAAWFPCSTRRRGLYRQFARGR
jgi:hypothetical protein